MMQLPRPLVFTLDIGGSSIKTGYIHPGDDIILARSKIELKSNRFHDLLRDVVTCCVGALNDHPEVGGVAISTTGGVARDGLVRNAGHFDGYRNIRWSEVLTPVVGDRPVTVINDGKACALAEYSQYSSLAPESFVHLVIGTGIGGGLLAFGNLLFGAQDTAGALGHIKISESSTMVCSCRRTGCVETFAAAPAILRTAGVEGPDGDLHDLARRAGAGDGLARYAFEEAGFHLGTAIGSMVSMLNPAAITLGGGVILADSEIGGDGPGPMYSAVVARVRESVFSRAADALRIERGRYGNDSGLIGAAHWWLKTAAS